MSTYASTSVDRRAAYYARAAEVIAADPLDFYTRAERGRLWQSRFHGQVRPEHVVSHYLNLITRNIGLLPSLRMRMPTHTTH